MRQACSQYIRDFEARGIKRPWIADTFSAGFEAGRAALPADPPRDDLRDEIIKEWISEASRLGAEVARLKAALRRIVATTDGNCEKSTAGIGSCFRNGNDPDGVDYVSRCCDACIAHAALGEVVDSPKAETE